MAYAFSDDLYMFGPQIIYLAILRALFVGFVFSISFEKPKGPKPATYGHIRTLVDLIDEWSPRMYRERNQGREW